MSGIETDESEDELTREEDGPADDELSKEYGHAKSRGRTKFGDDEPEGNSLLPDGNTTDDDILDGDEEKNDLEEIDDDSLGKETDVEKRSL